MKSFKTLNDMECAAKASSYCLAEIKIREYWLRVHYDVFVSHDFWYQWGKNKVSRDVAKNVLETE